MKEKEMEEALTIIWELGEKKEDGKEEVANEILQRLQRDLLDDLVSSGYVYLEGERVKLSSSGENIARSLIRRQRLAERLLSDVLEIGEEILSPFACEFGYILPKEVEESICTLLGHPKQCPHGCLIPEGDCCLKAREILKTIVIPLSKLKPKQEAKIVYILTGEHLHLHKLFSLGLAPGSIIKVHQIFPSFVIKSGEAQIAFEKSVAENIYVRMIKED